MNGKDCPEYKQSGIWAPELCKWCVARSCEDREFDYDLAGKRWSMQVEDPKVRKDEHGQFYWDFTNKDRPKAIVKTVEG